MIYIVNFLDLSAYKLVAK